MFLFSREPLGDCKALNIVFYSTLLPTYHWKRSLSYYMSSVSAAVLIILLCTVVMLHCILRRQLRQYVQSSPHSIMVILQLEVHIGASESFDQEKINHNNNTVALVQIPQHTSFSNESGCPFRFSHLSPSSLEKASDNDNSNRRILCLSASNGVSS